MKKELDFGIKEHLEKFEKLFGISKPAKKVKVLKKVRLAAKKVKKRRSRVFKERLGSNPLESDKGQFAGTSSIIEEKLINPIFKEPQLEIEKAVEITEIKKPEFKPRVARVKQTRLKTIKKVKVRRMAEATPLVKMAKPKIKHLRKAAAPELLKKKVGKIKIKRLKRKIKAPRLVSKRIPKLKIKAASKVLPKMSVSFADLPCLQRKYVSSNEIYWCNSRRARYHGALGNRKETLNKCSGCHVREPPKET